jgi:hypothetical protein
MQATSSIIIRAKPALFEALNVSGPEETSFDSGPQLLTYEEGDRVGWSRQQFYEGVKLLFLILFRSEFVNEQEWQKLGSPEISANNLIAFGILKSSMELITG